MHAAFAFIAKAAEVSVDKTFHVFGADFNTIEVSHLPVVIPSVALVVKLIMEREEANAEHYFKLALSGPTGDRCNLVQRFPFSARGADLKEWSSPSVTISVTFSPSIQTDGLHWLHLLVDETEIKKLPLCVEKAPLPKVDET
jgi:hypothetical protein